MAVEAAVAYAQDHGDRFVEELISLLRIPSISTAPEHIGDVRRAAEFCAAELRRIGLAAGKYWVCKRATPHAAEAMECLGGNGYVEESGMPRLYREAPLISIWEGSGNVAALDTLRALGREPRAVEAFLDELSLAVGVDPRYDDALAVLHKQFGDLEELQYRARHIVERMALLLQGSLLIRHGDHAVADAFVAARLAGDAGIAYGTLPTGLDTAAILARARLADG